MAAQPGDRPSLGRVVLYRPHGRRSPVPAIIVATLDTLHPDDVASGEVPVITELARVHLAALGGGHRLGNPVAIEHNVAPDVHVGAFDSRRYREPEQTAGTWRWPNLR